MKHLTNEELILLLEEWARLHGEIPSRQQWIEDVDTPVSDGIYRQRFGSWGNALRACGFEPKKPYPSKKCIENSVKAHKGKKSFASKGGRRINEQGYIEIWNPDHANAMKKGYILEHRMVMSDYLGRTLLNNEDVHHINGNKSDNWIENLEILTKTQHTALHEMNSSHNQSARKKNNCKYPNCDELTGSKYGLCTKHYKIQWQRLEKGLIKSIDDLREISRSHSNETKKLLSDYAKNQKRKNGKYWGHKNEAPRIGRAASPLPVGKTSPNPTPRTRTPPRNRQRKRQNKRYSGSQNEA